MNMPADQAAKVLRAFVGGSISPYAHADIFDAIDAAVSALEAVGKPVGVVVGTYMDRYVCQTVLNNETPTIGTNIYARPQPAYCCAKCGLPDMTTKKGDV